MKLFWCIAVGLSLGLGSGSAFANDKDKKKKQTKDGLLMKSSTSFDFSETLIEGKFKAPSGFFLQGRQSQSLSQMVKLRSNFRNELRNSRSSVKALIK